MLIRPRNVYNYNNYPPLGLISLGSSLKAAGHEVKIVNCALDSPRLWWADMIGIGFLTSEVPDAYRLLDLLGNSGRSIVAGGIHPTLFPNQVAAWVDHVIIGEGEDYIVQLANGQRLEKICPKCIVDLEKLPLPDYALDERIETFITSPLTDPLSARVRQPMRWLPYESSRGCSHRCAFCINTVTGNTRYRAKSAGKVIAEVMDIVGRHALTHVKFIDDDFFVDIDRVRSICDGLTGLGITWDAECRCDYFDNRRMDDATLHLARRSGLVQLTLGLESGSSHTLALMHKGFGPEQGEKAVRKCDEFGILARSSFILEVPGESLEDIKQTIAFVNSLRRYPHFVCGATTFRPYPKCELTTGLLESGQLEEPQSLAEWSEDMVMLYTAAEYARPWQVSPQFSERAAYFLTLESAARLGDHQIASGWGKLVNRVFRTLARWRNRLGFYAWPVDKVLYERFLKEFYKNA